MDIAKPITFQITPPSRFRRQTLRFDGSGVELNSYRLQGRVLNLSLTGIAIETRDQILVGGEYSLRLTCGALNADVTGRVQWCKMKGTRGAANGDIHPVFHAGLALIKYDDEAYNLLVERLQKADPKTAAKPLSAEDDETPQAEAGINAA
jgi:hypothetical protein